MSYGHYWPQALFDPTSYTSVMIGFSQFKALLRTDFRAKTREGDVAQITIDTDIIWQAPGWLVDLVVEHIEAFLRTTNSTLAEVIIGGRSSEGIERCNLQSLTPAQFRLLLEPAEFLFARYGDNKIRDFGAPELLAELAPRIVEFRALLYADPRIANDS